MGDVWPYGGPFYSDYATAKDAAGAAGFSDSDAGIMAAIGGAESSWDWGVINDTPSTGDYSVGVWQLNYYDGLYDSRVAELGTPESLVQGGVYVQAVGAHIIWSQQGFGAWSTYNSGAYLNYMSGGGGVGGTIGPALGPDAGTGDNNIPAGLHHHWSELSDTFGTGTTHRLIRLDGYANHIIEAFK